MGDEMKKHTLVFATLLLVVCLPQAALSWGDKEPTAIVIDNATGKPVEGAVALAQWFRAGGGGMFEGGVDVLDNAKEAFSDKDGKIYIDGFWGTTFFTGKPRLTIYEPGYVLWDSRRICPTLEGRTDFDEKRRTVRLLNFDTEAVRWISKDGFGPRVMQDLFFDECFDSGIGRKYPHQIKFRDIFYQHEIPLIDKEKRERKDKKITQ
jgi:hypothetical protein